MIVQRLGRLAAILAFVTFAACSEGNVLGPQNQPEINNAPDTFQWQVVAMDNISEALSYTWQNSGTSADVNQSPTLSGGSATLVVSDAAGTEVYRRSLAESGTFTTTAGSSGAWTIEVVLSGASGTLNFRVEKP